VDAAFTTIGAVDPEAGRVVHIKNTLEMGEIEISEKLLEELTERKDLRILDELGPLSFDNEGNINPAMPS